MYAWHCDTELEIFSGWGPRRSKTTYEAKFKEFLENPPADLAVFAVERAGELTGRIELSEIDYENRRACMGLFLGDKRRWGAGVGSAAVVIMLDYAFSVLNLSRIFARTYAFNDRARRLMKSVGFVEEGVLRSHEMHNGTLRDMCVYGMLATEFRERHPTLFSVPE